MVANMVDRERLGGAESPQMKLWLRRDHRQPHAFAGEVIEGQGRLDGGDATTGVTTCRR
jgi:hypothetical protein